MSEEIDPPNPGSGSMAESTANSRPRVWLLVGEKRGDNSQIRNVGLAVGWPSEEKRVLISPEWVQPKPPVKASLEHIDRERSDPIEGPWPDLVITAGRRLASVGLWIKQASGGRVRVVVIGKPRGSAAEFDLIVAASHYVMPDAPNVMRHALPLMPLDSEALAEAKKAWVGRLLLLPRPLTALLVGGPTGGLRFDVPVARDLLAKTEALVEATRGSLYVTTSRRTPPAIAEWLRETCSPSVQLTLYDAAAPPEENPYRGLLALADNFVVTTDSLSMMVDVAQLGRPLAIYPLERESRGIERLLEKWGLLRSLSPKTDSMPAGGFAARILAALGRPIHSRDLSAISRVLVEEGRATWLGDPLTAPESQKVESVERVAARIRGLFS